MVSEDTDVIALFLAHVDLLNGQSFRKSETQNCQIVIDIKQLRSGVSGNIAGLKLIEGLRLLKKVSNFKRDFKYLDFNYIAQSITLCLIYGTIYSVLKT